MPKFIKLHVKKWDENHPEQEAIINLDLVDVIYPEGKHIYMSSCDELIVSREAEWNRLLNIVKGYETI